MMFSIWTMRTVLKIPRLIDNKGNIFIMSNPKFKYHVLQLDLRLRKFSPVLIMTMNTMTNRLRKSSVSQENKKVKERLAMVWENNSLQTEVKSRVQRNENLMKQFNKGGKRRMKNSPHQLCINLIEYAEEVSQLCTKVCRLLVRFVVSF